MLVLTRKSNESVIVGDNVEVKVLGIRGDQVSLGFVAPREMKINRKEVFDAIQAENRSAAADEKLSKERLKGLIPGSK